MTSFPLSILLFLTSLACFSMAVLVTRQPSSRLIRLIFAMVGAWTMLYGFGMYFPLRNILPISLVIAILVGIFTAFRYGIFSPIPDARNAAIEHQPDPLIIINLNETIIDANPAAQEHIGITRMDIGRPIREHVPDWEQMRVNLPANQPNSQLIGQFRSQKFSSFDVSANPVRGNNGQTIAYTLTFRSHYEQAILEDQVRQLSSAVEQSPISIIITDPEANIEYVNPNYEILCGYSRNELVGRPMRMLKSGKMSHEFYHDLWETITNGQTWHGEILNRRKNGELYWEENRISPVIDQNGNIAHYMAIKEDISLRKQNQQYLERRLRELNAVHAISMAASSQLDLESLSSVVVKNLEEIFTAKSIFVAVLDPETNLIEFPYWTIDRRPMKTEPITLDEGLTSQVIKSGKSLLIDENFAVNGPASGAILTFVDEFGVPTTWLGMPLTVGEKTIGAISLQDYEKEHAFDPDDIRLLATIAANIAVAIENARLYESAQREITQRKQAEEQAYRRAEQLSLFYSMNRIISAGLELDSVLMKIWEQCQSVAQFDMFIIMIPNPKIDQTDIFMIDGNGKSEQQQSPVSITNAACINSQVYKEKRTIYIPDTSEYTQEPDFDMVPHNKNMRTYLGMPLLQPQGTLGVMAVESAKENAFNEEQIQFFENIASQAAIALENSRLYEETRRHGQEMSLLYEVGLSLTSNLDLNQVLHNIFENCQRILPVDAFYIALYDEESHVVQHPIFYDQGEFKQVALRDIRVTPGLSGEIILSKKTLYIPDALDPAINKNFQIVRAGGAPSRSFVGAPMTVRDQVVGVISMQNYRPYAYTPEHIRLLETVGSQAAIAIENSRLYQQAQEELLRRKKAQESLEKSNVNLQTQLSRVEALQQQLRDQAVRDPLTGLFNRRYLDEHLRQKLSMAQRKGNPLSLIMLDIDHFKELNDDHGHKIGDEFLRQLSTILLRYTRATDFACRYGGEEFLIVLSDAPIEIAARRAEEIRSAFENTSIQNGERMIKATISAGVAAYPIHGNDSESIIMQADQAMYMAKTSGRNRVVIWGHH